MEQARITRVLLVFGAAVLVAIAWRSNSRSEAALDDTPLVPGVMGREMAPLLGADSPGVPEATAAITRSALQGTPVAGLAGESAPDAPPALRGIVVDELGAPLAGATVTAEHDLWAGVDNWSNEPARVEAFATTLTDERGCFELALSISTFATVRAARGDCVPTIVREVAPGAELRLVLTPAATVVGDVLDALDRTPVTDTLVRVMHGLDLDELTVVRSNGVGHFRAEGLTAGTVAVIAAPETHVASRQVRVVVAPGATERIEVLVAAGRAVTGVVRDGVSLDVLEGARVSVWNFYGKTVLTDGQGRFRIDGVGLFPGILVADAVGYSRTEASFGAGASTDEALEVELTLTRALRLEGRVVDARSIPIPRAIVVASGRQTVEGMDRREWRETVAGEDGCFVIEGARADISLAVHARAPGFGARSFAARFPDAEGVVSLGDLVLEVQATLSGQVIDHLGEPVPHATVTVQRAGAFGLDFDVTRRVSSADRSGRFFFAGLAEDTLEVKASLWDGRDAAHKVRLRAGEQMADFVLALPGGETLRGRVTDATSELGLGDARIELERGEGNTKEWRVTSSDEAGEFEVIALAAGEWVVHAHPPSSDDRDAPPVYVTLRRTDVVADGSYLELPLARVDAELRGRVLDARDAPAAQRFVARLVDGEPVKDSGVLTDAHGCFTLRVPKGAVELAVYGTAAIRGDDDITVLEFDMGRRLLFADGPVARATVSAGTDEVTLRLTGE